MIFVIKRLCRKEIAFKKETTSQEVACEAAKSQKLTHENKGIFQDVTQDARLYSWLDHIQ